MGNVGDGNAFSVLLVMQPGSELQGGIKLRAFVALCASPRCCSWIGRLNVEVTVLKIGQERSLRSHLLIGSTSVSGRHDFRLNAFTKQKQRSNDASLAEF